MHTPGVSAADVTLSRSRIRASEVRLSESHSSKRTLNQFTSFIFVGDTVKYRLIVLLSAVAGSFSIVTAGTDEPTIRCEGNKHILVLPQQMRAALNTFNPQFRTWESGDYVDGACVGKRKDPNQSQAPFALIVDVNKDGTRDIILDGHDEKQCLLICVLSQPHGYFVILVSSSRLVNPQTIVNYRDGRKCNGLLYSFYDRCIWTSEEHFDKRHTFVFQKIIPQQSGPDGKLLSPEGGSISYYFENGRFVVGDFDPL